MELEKMDECRSFVMVFVPSVEFCSLFGLSVVKVVLIVVVVAAVGGEELGRFQKNIAVVFVVSV
jgi:hypothetical protein